MELTLEQFIVLLVVGGLAGSMAGRLVTFSREGYGRWTNLVIGIAGSLVGGFVFRLFKIDLGLGDLKVSFEDLIAAFGGSLVCIFGWWIVRKFRRRPQSG
jgi:uncharacterized membrane protein YeaQ/YmgE (transglycosylase-associated protein family)